MFKQALLTLTAAFALNSCTTKPLAEDLEFNSKLPALSQDNILTDKDTWTWGGSVIKGEDGKYHMLYARWPEGLVGRSKEDQEKGRLKGFSGWLKYSEIAHAVSDKPNGPFKYTKTVLTGSGKEGAWDQWNAHNPHIKKFNGKYYLYYIATSPVEDKSWWKALIGGQRIGVIETDSLTDLIAGNWEHPDKPLVVPDNVKTFHRAVNPSVTEGPDGKYYMMFKSYTDITGRNGHMTHWLATAPTPTGPFEVVANVLHSKEYSAEDPYFWYDKKRERFYAIVKSWANNSKLTKIGSLALITSKDGITGWKPAKHKLVVDREYTNNKGEKVQLTNIERPQLLLDEDNQPICLYTSAMFVNGEKKGFYQGYPTANLHFLLKKD